MAAQYAYVMKDMTKSFPGAQKPVLSHINLQFYHGAKIGIVGPNGAGKSTLMKIMAGIDTDFQGEAWPGENVTVGYLPQEPQLDPEKTVRQVFFDFFSFLLQEKLVFRFRTSHHTKSGVMRSAKSPFIFCGIFRSHSRFAFPLWFFRAVKKSVQLSLKVLSFLEPVACIAKTSRSSDASARMRPTWLLRSASSFTRIMTSVCLV